MKHICPGLVPGTVTAVVGSFTLEHAEKTFAGGVVATVTHGTHRTDECVPLQETLVIAAAELAATVRMQGDLLLQIEAPFCSNWCQEFELC